MYIIYKSKSKNIIAIKILLPYGIAQLPYWIAHKSDMDNTVFCATLQ